MQFHLMGIHVRHTMFTLQWHEQGNRMIDAVLKNWIAIIRFYNDACTFRLLIRDNFRATLYDANLLGIH